MSMTVLNMPMKKIVIHQLIVWVTDCYILTLLTTRNFVVPRDLKLFSRAQASVYSSTGTLYNIPLSSSLTSACFGPYGFVIRLSCWLEVGA